jgi:hypothetical protein
MASLLFVVGCASEVEEPADPPKEEAPVADDTKTVKEDALYLKLGPIQGEPTVPQPTVPAVCYWCILH